MNIDADISGFQQRLIAIIGEETPHSFAKKCKMGDSSLRPYLKGSLPRMDKLVVMAQVGNVNIEWLATGKGPMRPGEERKGNGASINQLEDPLIKDIKLWLRDMTTDNPNWRAWFEIELLQKIPQFKEWREKKQSDHPDQEVAIG